MEQILLIIAMGAVFYFLLIRPGQKRAKNQRAVIGALTTGTRVVLTSGMFATVRHLGERHAIVELAPGVEVTIVKGNIARPTTEDEEEFEFSDDVDNDILVDAVPVDGGLDPEIVADEVLLPEDVEGATAADQTFDPRGTPEPDEDGSTDGDISAEELQRRFDN